MRAGWGVVVLLLCGCSVGTAEQPDGERAALLVNTVRMAQAADMRTVKSDSCFFWQSNGDALRQRNLCVYSYSATRLDAHELLNKRDSVMKLHVKGAADSIYPTTLLRSVSSALTTAGGVSRLELSGLWQMEGDAMGGPFVCCAVVDSVRRRVVVADGFVYAPGRDKHALMQRLRDIVRTINIQ